MNNIRSEKYSATPKTRKSWYKPGLVEYGTVSEMTKSGYSYGTEALSPSIYTSNPV